MAKQNYTNVRKYHKRHKTINVGVIVFLIVFIYLAVTVFLYLSKENVSIYQITEEGSLARNTEYTGIIVRDEHVVKAENTGYIRYYIRQGERVGNGDLIYSLDESGEVTRKLTESYSYEETLKKSSLEVSHIDVISNLSIGIVNRNDNVMGVLFEPVDPIDNDSENLFQEFLNVIKKCGGSKNA